MLDKLDESVRLRLMSDVPLGAMLSGGLDSSLIVALMARHMTEPLETFAVGFAGEDSELPDARRVADALGAEHHELEVALRDRARTTCSRLDLAPRRAAGRPLVARLPARSASSPREHVTVALSGQGADELFGGYRKHRVASLAEQLAAAARRALARGAAAALRRGPGPRGAARRRPRRPPIPAARLLASSGFVHADLRGELFGGALAEHAGAARARVLEGTLAGAPGAAPLEAALYLDARLGLVDDMLTYFDRASMACSLEVRVPFLDHELVELCARIPTGAQGPAACRASTSCALAARGQVPDFVLVEAEARLLQRVGRDLGRRRRRRARRTASCSARTRRTRASSTGRRSAARWPSAAPAGPATRSCCSRS